MSDLDSMSDEADAPRRTEQRDSMMLHATLRRAHDSYESPVRIRNLSAGGMMAECELPLARGEEVEVRLKNVGAVKATVAWSVDGRIGIAFDAPIDRLRARRPVAAAPVRTKPQMPQSRRPGLRLG
ncbi:MAG: PilZ domain-containing protein [Sphingomonadaceae bacterium]|nr:PilZ domain-containing protein [Sphingomonadaceae bacterium]